MDASTVLCEKIQNLMEILINNLSYFENYIFIENSFIGGKDLSILDILFFVSMRRLFKDFFLANFRNFNF